MDRAFTTGSRDFRLQFGPEDTAIDSRLVLRTMLRAWHLQKYDEPAFTFILAMVQAVDIDGAGSVTVHVFEAHDVGGRQHLIIEVEAAGDVPAISEAERVRFPSGGEHFTCDLTFSDDKRAAAVRIRTA